MTKNQNYDKKTSKNTKKNENQENNNNNDNNNNDKTFSRSLLVLAISIFIGVTFSLYTWLRLKYDPNYSLNNKGGKLLPPAGEELAAFARRMEARVSGDVGLVQHQRIGGGLFTLQVQTPAPGNATLVSIPISSAISISTILEKFGEGENDSPSSSNSFIKQLTTTELRQKFEKRTDLLAQLGFDTNLLNLLNSKENNNKKKETAMITSMLDQLFDYVQMITLLSYLKSNCDLSSSASSAIFHHALNESVSATELGLKFHFCPWIRHIVIPSTKQHLEFSNLKWRPQVISKCLRPSSRQAWEASTIQVSALVSMIREFYKNIETTTSSSGNEAAMMLLFGEELNLILSSTSTTSATEKEKELRNLVEWSVFVLRTRSHQSSEILNGKSFIVPLLDLNDKRVGTHLYRKTSRQHPTAQIIVTENININTNSNSEKKKKKKNMFLSLVTTETHKVGAYPLTAPPEWQQQQQQSSKTPSSPVNLVTPQLALEQYGVTTTTSSDNKNNNRKKNNNDGSLTSFASDSSAWLTSSSPLDWNTFIQSFLLMKNEKKKEEASKNQKNNIDIPSSCFISSSSSSSSSSHQKPKNPIIAVFNFSSGVPSKQLEDCCEDISISISTKTTTTNNKFDVLTKLVEYLMKQTPEFRQDVFVRNCHSLLRKKLVGKEMDIEERNLILKQAKALKEIDEENYEALNRALTYAVKKNKNNRQ